MKALLAALAVASALNAMSFLATKPSPAAACSYGPAMTGYAGMMEAVERSDLIFVGLVVDETLIHIEEGAEDFAVGEATIRVDHVLRGEFDDPRITLKNRRPYCGDPGPRMQPGEKVVLFLEWLPNVTTPQGGRDFEWRMTLWGSKILFKPDGTAWADEPWAEPRLTSMGTTEALLTDLGGYLDLPPSETEAIIANQRDIDGPAGRWTLAAQLGVVAALLFAVAVLIERRRRTRPHLTVRGEPVEPHGD